MKKIIAASFLLLSITSQAFIVQDNNKKEDSSYVAVTQSSSGYSFYFCEEGQVACRALGPQESYTKGDIDRLIKKEKIGAIKGVVAAGASVGIGMLAGFPVALGMSLTSVALGSASAETLYVVGAFTVSATTNATANSLLHRLNPVDRIDGIRVLSSVNKDEFKRVEDVKEYANWLDDVLRN